MTTSNKRTPSGAAPPSTPSRFIKLEEATKKLIAPASVDPRVQEVPLLPQASPPAKTPATPSVMEPYNNEDLTHSASIILQPATLVYCNNLLRAHLSPSSAAVCISAPLDASQQASIAFILQNQEEQDKIRELSTKVVEEFLADSVKTLEKISEVVLLGPFLDREYHRKLLNCFITEFETVMLVLSS
ncbi:hypothetical protein BGW39_002165 [Mortierella sp. 14UC]|nr:hypothetical protein BGW39_002165 [Mortierella sp. 14UC]